MPHQCTNCGRTFPDGSKEMLSGCPDCGGNKFQFHPGSVSDGTSTDAPSSPSSPASAADADAADAADVDAADADAAPDPAADAASDSPGPTPDSPGPTPDSPGPTPDDGSPTSPASASVRDRTGTGDATSGGPPAESSHSSAASRPPSPPDADDSEDTAQADARRDVVSPDELAEAADAVPPAESPDDAPEATPDLADLRAELNEQFESIRIVDRGQYELNLMELYDREEYIISLQEDGRYVIEVSEPWRDD